MSLLKVEVRNGSKEHRKLIHLEAGSLQDFLSQEKMLTSFCMQS